MKEELKHIEDGKTFYIIGSEYERQKDANWQGKRTVYNRCKNCGKLVSRQGQTGHKHKYCKALTPLDSKTSIK